MKTMNARFETVVDGIYRLNIPFDTVYTSVFLVKSESGAILVDCATTDEDVDGYIVSALCDMDIELTDINSVVVTHNHSDHAGGLRRILCHAPNIEVVREPRQIFDGICAYPMCGHANEMIGLFDPRTGTLISGDGLQGAGIGMFRCSLAAGYAAYSESIARIKADARIQNILFSHAYEPWYSNAAFGREEVEKRLDDCPPCAIKEMRASEERK